MCANISSLSYILKSIQVQCYFTFGQLYSDLGDFSFGVCRLVKTTAMTKNNPDTDILSQRFASDARVIHIEMHLSAALPQNRAAVFRLRGLQSCGLSFHEDYYNG